MNNFGNNFVEAAGTSVQNITHEAKLATSGALRGVLEATRTLELLTFGAYYKTSSSAFVTFKSRVTKCCSNQLLLSHDNYALILESAPNPSDILWENVSLPKRQITIRTVIADSTIIVGALFWSIVVGFITTITNLEALSKRYIWLQAYSTTALFRLLNNYLAFGLLLGLLSALPLIFDWIARKYEGLKLESEIQNSIMSRLFLYQWANVYVSVGLGSIASSINQIIASPSNILNIVGGSLPQFSIYFATLIATKTFTAVPLEMLRTWPFIEILSVQLCLNKKKCTRRELREGALADRPMLYGWMYPNILMVVMILFIYSTIAPFVTLFALVYFIFAYILYKYQILYVYVNKYQSGGYMFYSVFNKSMLSLLAGVFVLLCYLAIRSKFTVSLVIIIATTIFIYLISHTLYFFSVYRLDHFMHYYPYSSSSPCSGSAAIIAINLLRNVLVSKEPWNSTQIYTVVIQY